MAIRPNETLRKREGKAALDALKNIYRNDLLSKLRIRVRKLARYLVTSPTRSLIPVIVALEGRKGEVGLL